MNLNIPETTMVNEKNLRALVAYYEERILFLTNKNEELKKDLACIYELATEAHRLLGLEIERMI